MLTNHLTVLYDRELKRLIEELKAYPDEAKIWIVDKEINNSAGNLALHLVGNLRHFIGAILGNSGFVRKRDLEFSGKDVPRKNLIKDIEETRKIVKEVLQELTEDDLLAVYPVNLFDKPHPESIVLAETSRQRDALRRTNTIDLDPDTLKQLQAIVAATQEREKAGKSFRGYGGFQ